MAHVDLNLLVALDALLEEGSVQGAADRLHLTQPAMSRALARLRRATGDEILVRTGRTMTPTPRAVELREQVGDLVARARDVLSPVREVDLAALTRVFTVQGHDALVAALAPALVQALSDEAPRAAVRFLGEAPADTPGLARGQVDLEVGAGTSRGPDLRQEVVGEDRVVLVMRAGHRLSRGRLTPARLVTARHLSVSRRGHLTGAVDEALLTQGLRREVLAALPTSGAALTTVASSDAVAVVAERLCGPLISALGLTVRTLPLDLPPAPVVLAWHRRFDADPAHRWLRDHARTALVAALEG